MFAVIRSGGKQHRVAENDRIIVERLDGEPGALIAFDQVLMLAEDGQPPLVGSAVPAAARVFGRVLEQTRGPKLIVFKKKRRKNHRRTKGHRQHLTAVRIASISPTGDRAAAEAEAPVPAAAETRGGAAQAAAVESASERAAELEPVLQE